MATSKSKIKKCPYCAEEIQSEAIKCKHCGSILNQPVGQDKNKIRANQHPSYVVFTILALLFPIAGVIVGAVFLTKQDLLDRKVGEHTIAMSGLGFILGVFLWILIFSTAGF